MTRNRGSTYCECGQDLIIEMLAGHDNPYYSPMRFRTYVGVIGLLDREDFINTYLEEYKDLIVSRVLCSSCKRAYAMWMNAFDYVGMCFDTSFWSTFNDEEAVSDINQRTTSDIGDKFAKLVEETVELISDWSKFITDFLYHYFSESLDPK